VFAGPYCAPPVQRGELRAHAEKVLRRAIELASPDVPLITAVDEGRVVDVIVRRVKTAEHDLVVVGRRRGRSPAWSQRVPAPVIVTG
jgi:hypothetical protein